MQYIQRKHPKLYHVQYKQHCPSTDVCFNGILFSKNTQIPVPYDIQRCRLRKYRGPPENCI